MVGRGKENILMRNGRGKELNVENDGVGLIKKRGDASNRHIQNRDKEGE